MDIDEIQFEDIKNTIDWNDLDDIKEVRELKL